MRPSSSGPRLRWTGWRRRCRRRPMRSSDRMGLSTRQRDSRSIARPLPPGRPGPPTCASDGTAWRRNSRAMTPADVARTMPAPGRRHRPRSPKNASPARNERRRAWRIAMPSCRRNATGSAPRWRPRWQPNRPRGTRSPRCTPPMPPIERAWRRPSARPRGLASGYGRPTSDYARPITPSLRRGSGSTACARASSWSSPDWAISDWRALAWLRPRRPRMSAKRPATRPKRPPRLPRS